MKKNNKINERQLILLLSIIISILCILFVSSLNFNLIFQGRTWVNFFWRFIDQNELIPAILLTLVIFIMFFSPPEIAVKITKKIADNPYTTSAIVTAALSIGTLTIYHNHPLCLDEYIDWYQSRVFAQGKIYGNWPPELLDWLLPTGFHNYGLFLNKETGDVISGVFPGYALVQAPFVYLNIPWLCNPVLTGATIILLHKIATTLFQDKNAPGWIILFTIGSPVFFSYGISYYSSTGQLFFNMLFFYILIKNSNKNYLVAGLIGGFSAFYHHPIRHVFFALPIIIIAISAEKEKLKSACLLVAGYIPPALILGGIWIYLRNEVSGLSVIPAEKLNPIEHLITLLKIGINRLSWPSEVMIYTKVASSIKLWLWAAPLIPLLAILALPTIKDRRLLALAASSAATVIGYLALAADDQGHGWGDRFFHSVWAAIPILAFSWIKAGDSSERNNLLKIVGFGAILSIAVLLPFRMYQIEKLIRMHLQQLPSQTNGNEVILVTPNGAGYYLQDLIQNDPFLKGKKTILLSNGKERDQEILEKFYPDCVWKAHYPWGNTCAR